MSAKKQSCSQVLRVVSNRICLHAQKGEAKNQETNSDLGTQEHETQTAQLRSKRENFQLKSSTITTTEVTVLPTSFDWK
jgi:hypothetical protein